MEIFLGAFTAEWEQRKAVLLHDLTLGVRSLPEEVGRRRRRGVVEPAGLIAIAKPSGLRGRAGGQASRGSLRRRADRPMRVRFAGLASGSQPAVVKMASFGGGSRLGAMINYVSRNGSIVVENERGDQLRGRDQLSAVGDEWDHLMKNRAESRDIGVFKIWVADGVGVDGNLFDRAREVVRYALGDRAFVFSVSASADRDGLDINGVAVLRDAYGERLTADDKAASIVQTRMKSAGADADFRFTGNGNGTEYGTGQVRSLVAAHKGEVRDEQGRTIADAKRAGDLVQLEWREQLHSRKARDVMHLILSARAGTDTAAFQNAARDFLSEQFSGHRYVFSLHDAGSDPKAEADGGKRPHVHVHAIVAMRSNAGDRIETTIAAFRQWRLTMAEKARSHGIKMEMTDRRDRTCAPAYSKNQVRSMNTIGRTQHGGTSAAAERRYHAKRNDLTSHSATARSQAYMHKAYAEWQEVGYDRESGAQLQFIRSQMARLEEPRITVANREAADQDAGDPGSQFRTYLLNLADLVSDGDDMRHMTRNEFEAYEKRVETALFHAQKIMRIEDRTFFEGIARAAREHVNVRREIVELFEKRTETGASRQMSLLGSEHARGERQRWYDAVARHGLQATDAANKALVDIDCIREAIDRVKEGWPNEVTILKKELDTHVSKAVELGLSGNGIIHEFAEFDEDLKSALQALARDLQKAGREEASASAPRDDSAGNDRSTPPGDSSTYPSSRQDTGDTTNSNPTEQHLPRFEQIQPEANDRSEREAGDGER